MPHPKTDIKSAAAASGFEFHAMELGGFAGFVAVSQNETAAA